MSCLRTHICAASIMWLISRWHAHLMVLGSDTCPQGVPRPPSFSLGPPLHRHSTFGHLSCPSPSPAAPRLAVLGRPFAPWPGVPTPRVCQVLVLTSRRARGLCSTPGCPPLRHVSGSGGLRLGTGVARPRGSLGVCRPKPGVANG
jgi:hypothetical protein